MRLNSEGFTLIELLVVIAIIAILVVIVVTAINPAQRIIDATDRTNSANVRSAASVIGACITHQLSIGNLATGSTGVFSNTSWNPGTGKGGCADTIQTLTKYGTFAQAPAVTVVAGGGYTRICAYSPSSGSGIVSWDSSTGSVTSPGAGTTNCP